MILNNKYFVSKRGLSIMDDEKNWMLMTYYCPTHGNLGMAKKLK